MSRVIWCAGFSLLGVLILVLAATAFVHRGAKQQIDVQKLMQGNWKVVELSRDGEAAPSNVVDGAGYLISKNTLVPTVNGVPRKDSAVHFTLGSSQYPDRIELIEGDSGERSIGIFMLSHRRLKICVRDVEQLRPTMFDSGKQEVGATLLLLERAG